VSTNDPTDIWAWTYADRKRLRDAGGGRLAILDGWDRYNSYHHRNDAAADQVITSAIAAAKAEGELRWELLLRHWRLQLWLRHDLRKVLPEAIDLLNLATDERVRDVPQRICAFHDVVDCHVQMDAVGYYEDIVANAQDVLAQLPARHTCATCARLNVAMAAGAAGHTKEAEQWIARLLAQIHQPKSSWPSWSNSLGDIYEGLGKWDDAEREYADAARDARQSEYGDFYVRAVLGLARVRAKRGNALEAAQTLHEARRSAKYSRGTSLLADLLDTEGWVAEVAGEQAAALDYFTRASRYYLALGRHRQAALTGLHAVEMAQAANLAPAEEALSLAARAVGMMPPASTDVYRRLERLGKQPVPPDDPAQQGQMSAQLAEATARDGEVSQMDASERAVLEGSLAAHMQSGNVRAVAMILYRQGRWDMEHKRLRAALDPLIANAVLERLLQLPMSDREDALELLKRAKGLLPPGSVGAALKAAESGPSALLAPLLGQFPLERWQWLVKSVAADLEEQPVVEPEPEDEERGFGAWLEHVASMTALILRFHEQAEPEKCERWAQGLDETAAEIEAHLGLDGQGREPATLARGLAALARGANPEEVAGQVMPPFNEVIEQACAVAQEPVWHHPGSSPLDFLVEQVAQRAVRILRIRDEHRASRLANMAWRFELMALDLEKDKRLQPSAHFLKALSALLHADGQALPKVKPRLKKPFDAVLAAVYEAGK
jgi:tetratricopeptide (TPR) repeat protein